MSDTSPFGSRSDDPLLKNDPLAPEAEQDASDASADEQATTDRGAAEASSGGGNTSVPDDSVFSTPPSSENGTDDGSHSPSRDDLLAYLIENRAAIDVLFEMLAFDRADGKEQDYRHFLEAMQKRHDQATQTYRDALDIELPETHHEDEGISPLDDPPMS